MLRRVSKVGRYLKQEGGLSLLKRLFSFIGSLFFVSRRVLLLTRQVDPLPQRVSLPTGVSVDRLNPGQIDLLSQVVYYDPGEIHRRLEERQDCVIAILDGKIVHSSWLSPKSEYAWEIQGKPPLGPSQFYLYNCRTLAPYRGRGLFKAVLERALERTRERGGRSLAAIVEEGNSSSLSAFQSIGFHVKEEMVIRRILWKRRLETKVPHAGLTQPQH